MLSVFSQLSSWITITIPFEENHYLGSDPNREVEAVPLIVQGYNLVNHTVMVVENEEDESQDFDKGLPRVCQKAIRKISPNDVELKSINFKSPHLLYLILSMVSDTKLLSTVHCSV
jgi:hypothetical protein